MPSTMSDSSPARFTDVGKKIVGIGANYRDLVTQLGLPEPTEPMVFLKPTTAYVTQGNPIKIPRPCTSLLHEVELGVVIGKRGVDIPQSAALDYVAGYILALDMTSGEFLVEAKKKGQPWTLSKGFDTSCPVSDFMDKSRLPSLDSLRLWLKVNGEMRQDGSTSNMIFSVPYVISYVSSYFTLEPGDVILTGTPAGPSQVKAGDVIQAGLEDVMEITFRVERK